MNQIRPPRKTRLHSLGFALLAAMTSLQAQDGTWIGAANGVWSASGNWQGGQIADGAGAVADFSTLNLTGFRTVTLDGSRTIGGLIAEDRFDPTHAWIFNAEAGSGSVLTLDSGGATQPFFNILPGLATPRYARFNVPLAGSQGLVKTAGLGTLWLNGDNSGLTGGVRVQQGTLLLTHPLALGTSNQPLTLQLSGSANVNTNWVRLELGDDLTGAPAHANLTVANPIQIGPYVGPSVGAIAAVSTDENRVTTLSGQITVFGSGGTGGLFTGPSAKGSRLDITGEVLAGDGNSSTLTQTIDTGHVRLAGGGTIPNWRNNAYLSLGADEGISGAGSLSVVNAYNRPATLDLNGHDLTLASLGRLNRSAVFNSDDDTTSVLTIDHPSTANFTYADSLSGNLSLVKKGGGTFTLSSSTSSLNNAITEKTKTTVTLIEGDTLGLAPGQLLQGTPVNMSTTAGSTTASVTSTLGIKKGMSISGPNVVAGTVISELSGSTVTLSQAATASGSVVSHNFSPFPADTTIVSITGLTSFTASKTALVDSVETTPGGEDIVTSFGFRVPSLHAYTGRTVLNGGVFSISTISDPLFPSGLGKVPTVSPEFLVFEGGTLRYTGTDASTSRGFTVRDAISAFLDVGISTTNLTISGDSPAATGGLTKLGPGTLTLTGEHAYTGPTSVSAGTLVIEDGGSLDATSPVTVRPGAVLAATVQPTAPLGSVDVLNGGTLEVGPMPSATSSGSSATPTLTVSDLTLNHDALIEFEFAGGATHDRLRVTGNGGLNLDGGFIGVYRNGGFNPVNTAGEYAIIDYEGSFTGSLDSLVFVNSEPGFTYKLEDRPATTEIALVVAAIATRTWSSATGGDWITDTNWNAGNSADSFGEAADFGPALSAPATVDLNAPVTVSGLSFRSTRAYTIAGSGSLTLSAGAAIVDVETDGSAGHHRIDVPVTLTGPLRVSTIANSSITFGSTVSTTATAELVGLGTVAFAGDADIPFMTVSGGTLQIGAGGTTGSLNAAEVNLATGAKLSLRRSDDFTFTSSVRGSGASLLHDGSGTTTLTGTNSTYTALVLNNGTLRFGSIDAMPGEGDVLGTSLAINTIFQGSTPISSGTLDLNGMDIELGGILTGGAGGVITDNSGTPGTSIFTYGSGSTSTYPGTLVDGATRDIALVKTRTSSLTLTGDNQFSGGTTLLNGTLIAGHDNALGSGPVLIDLIGTGGSSNFTRLVVNGGLDIAAPLTIARQYSNNNAVLSLSSGASAASTWSGPITIDASGTNGYTFQGGGASNRVFTLSGRISAPGLALSSSRFLRFANPDADSDFAVLEHSRDTLSLGADNALPKGLQLFLSSSNSTVFDLLGHDQELAQVVRASTNYSATVTNSGPDIATLTLSPVSDFTFSGTFTDDLALVKTLGSAEITLTGASTHKGDTELRGGRLILSGAGRLGTFTRLHLRNGAELDARGISGSTLLSLSAGATGSGTINLSIITEPATERTVSIGTVFEPEDLTIIADNVQFTSTTATRYDLTSTYGYDRLEVDGAMRNAGPLTVTVAAGVNLKTGRDFQLATASGGITSGFSSVTVDETALTEQGTTGVWTGDVVSTTNSRTYSYSFDETTGTLTVTAGDDASPLDDWLVANIPDPANRDLDADPDGDGQTNLLEYATRGDPMVAGPVAVTVGRNGNFLTLTYDRREDSSLTYTVEGADDLAGSWTTVVSASPANPTTGEANDSVTVTDTADLTVSTRRFLRLKVEHSETP